MGRLSPISRQVAHVLRTRSPVALADPRDLHVLSTPPAFVLSQDQTLQEFDIARSSNRCHHAVAHDSVSESLKLFGSSSPRRPEQTPVQRARLAHPDSQFDCQKAVCRSRRQPPIIPCQIRFVNPARQALPEAQCRKNRYPTSLCTSYNTTQYNNLTPCNQKAQRKGNEE